MMDLDFLLFYLLFLQVELFLLRQKILFVSGTNNSSDATKAIIVKRLNDGGQSINILS